MARGAEPKLFRRNSRRLQVCDPLLVLVGTPVQADQHRFDDRLRVRTFGFSLIKPAIHFLAQSVIAFGDGLNLGVQILDQHLGFLDHRVQLELVRE